MVGWTAFNSYSNKSSQPKRKLVLFPSGFTPHYYIRIKSQDYNKTDNAIALDHFQARTLCYQNLWKNSSGKGVGEGCLPLPQPKSLLHSDWFMFQSHLLFLYFFQMYRNKAGTFTNKMKPLTSAITHKLSTTLDGFHKGTNTAVTCKLLESSGTKCCDLHKLQNCTHHMSLLFRCKSIHKDLNKYAWGI